MPIGVRRHESRRRAIPARNECTGVRQQGEEIVMRGLKRLYFLVPDVDTARKIVDELLLVHIPYEHIHVLARAETPLEELPEAGLAQKSDLVPALERGLAVGGSAGVVAGLLALAFPPAGVVAAGGAILFGALGGAAFGAWVSSMVGVSLPNSRLTRFEAAVEQGMLLMMVDVPKARVDEFEEMIREHHPEADIEGVEPTIPSFP
jgi:hypothetical protein